MIASKEFKPLGKRVPMGLDEQEESSHAAMEEVHRISDTLNNQKRGPTDSELRDLLTECCHMFACYFKAIDNDFITFLTTPPGPQDDELPAPVFRKLVMYRRFHKAMERVASVQDFEALSVLTEVESDAARSAVTAATYFLPEDALDDVGYAQRMHKLANEQTQNGTFQCNAVITMFETAFLACAARQAVGRLGDVTQDQQSHAVALRRYMEKVYAEMISKLCRLEPVGLDKQHNNVFSISKS